MGTARCCSQPGAAQAGPAPAQGRLDPSAKGLGSFTGNPQHSRAPAAWAPLPFPSHPTAHQALTEGATDPTRPSLAPLWELAALCQGNGQPISPGSPCTGRAAQHMAEGTSCRGCPSRPGTLKPAPWAAPPSPAGSSGAELPSCALQDQTLFSQKPDPTSQPGQRFPAATPGFLRGTGGTRSPRGRRSHPGTFLGKQQLPHSCYTSGNS